MDDPVTQWGAGSRPFRPSSDAMPRVQAFHATQVLNLEGLVRPWKALMRHARPFYKLTIPKKARAMDIFILFGVASIYDMSLPLWLYPCSNVLRVLSK